MCVISFWLFSLIFSVLVIMSVVSMFDTLVHMFSMSNVHILVSLLIYMVFRSLIIWCCVYCMYTPDVGSYVMFL
jgi:hypothetical protein